MEGLLLSLKVFALSFLSLSDRVCHIPKTWSLTQTLGKSAMLRIIGTSPCKTHPLYKARGILHKSPNEPCLHHPQPYTPKDVALALHPGTSSKRAQCPAMKRCSLNQILQLCTCLPAFSITGNRYMNSYEALRPFLDPPTGMERLPAVGLFGFCARCCGRRMRSWRGSGALSLGALSSKPYAL